MRKKLNFKRYNNEEYLTEMDFNEIEFPKEIHIAYAVCGKQCGNKEYIVDGQSQVCEYCTHNMFRTETAIYRRVEKEV